MSRARATRHCHDCVHHYQVHHRQPHYCRAAHYRTIPFNPSRTSPDWCPVGHIIPGIPYPTFTPGPDPWDLRNDTDRTHETQVSHAL